MAIQKPTKAQVTAAITSAVGILVLITTTLPVDNKIKLYIGFAIGVIGIIGNIYGVYQVPNGISDKATASELLTAASVLTNVAVARTVVAAQAAPQITLDPVEMPSTDVITGPTNVPATGVTAGPVGPLGQ